MFDDLKERPRGFRPKEKVRLYATVSACLVLGAIVFGNKGCDGYGVETRLTVKPKEKPAPTTVPPGSGS